MSGTRFCISVCMLLGSAQGALSQPASPADGQGDKLPPGAFARVGAAQFRVSARAWGIRYLDAGKRLLVATGQEMAQLDDEFIGHDAEASFVRFDARTGEKLYQCSSPIASPSLLAHSGRGGGGTRMHDFIQFPTACVSPDGNFAVPADWIHRGVLDLRSGKQLFECGGSSESTYFTQFSPDSKTLGTIVWTRANGSGNDNEPNIAIRLWDVPSQKETLTLKGPAHAGENFQPHCFTFSPNGRHLAATGYEDGKGGIVRIWDLAGKEESWRLEGESNGRKVPRVFGFTPDSKAIAALEGGKIKLWDLGTKQAKAVVDYPKACAVLDFSPDNRYLIAGTRHELPGPKKLQMWELATGKEIELPCQDPTGFIFSDDGRTLVVAEGVKGELMICQTASGALKQRIPSQASRRKLEEGFYLARQGAGWPFALSPDGKTLVFADAPGQIRHFDVASGKEIALGGQPTSPAEALRFSGDGKKLLAACVESVTVHTLDGAAAAMHLMLDPARKGGLGTRHGAGSALGERVKPKCECIDISSDGQIVAAGWENGTVAAWTTANGKLLWQLPAHESSVKSLEFAADDETLVTTGLYDGLARRLGTDSGASRRSMAWDADQQVFSRRYVMVDRAARIGFTWRNHHDEVEIEVWEMASMNSRAKFKAPGTPLALSPGGRWLLVAGHDAYHLLDALTGEEQRSFSCNEECKVLKAGFSPDGRTLAGIAGKEQIRVWDVATGTVLGNLVGHDGGALAIAFRPDGKAIATSAADGTLLLWHAPQAAVPAAALKSAPGKAPRAVAGATDAAGEALPPSAAARLGSLRFQNGLGVGALRYSEDGQSILAETCEETNGTHRNYGWTGLAQWNAVSGKLKWQKPLMKEGVVMAITGIPAMPDFWSVSPNSKLAVVPQRIYDHTTKTSLRVREIGSEKVILNVDEPAAYGEIFRFTPDGRYVISSSGQFAYDLKTGKKRVLRDEDDSEVRLWSTFISPDGRYAVQLEKPYEKAGRVQRFQLDQPNKLVTVKATTLNATMLAFSPDNKTVALVLEREKRGQPHLAILDLESGNIAKDFGNIAQANPKADEENALRDWYFLKERRELLLFSPDGRQIVSFAKWQEKDQVRRWDVGTGRELPPIKNLEADFVQFSPDGKYLAVSDSKAVHLHDATTGKEIRSFPLAAVTIRTEQSSWQSHHDIGGPFAFSPDSSTIAVAAMRTIRQWNVATGEEIGPAPVWHDIIAIAASNNCAVAASYSPGLIEVWETGAGKLLLRLTPAGLTSKEGAVLSAMSLTAAGNRLAVGSSDGNIALFDVKTGTRVRELKHHELEIASLSFSPDGATLTSVDLRAQVAVWNADSGEILRQQAITSLTYQEYVEKYGWLGRGRDEDRFAYTPYGYRNWSIPTFSGNGSALILPGDRAIAIHDVATGKLLADAIKHHSYNKFFLSADGKSLVVNQRYTENGQFAGQPSLKLIDVNTARERRSFSSTVEILDFALSPDANLLAACGSAGIRLWDARTGSLLATFAGHRGDTLAVRFSADGAALVSAGRDGTMLVWDLVALRQKGSRSEISRENLEKLWADLASDDAETAHAAMCQLVSSPEQACKLIREGARAAASPKSPIAKLIADLDSAQPKIRATAMSELSKLAELAEPALRAALQAKPSLEQRLRIDQLLERVAAPLADLEKLRALRAIEVLELVGTPESAAALELLAGGAAEALVTREAKGALRRMKGMRG
jgi:WD40 repeat protein